MLKSEHHELSWNFIDVEMHDFYLICAGEKLTKEEAKSLMKELCEPADDEGFMPFIRKYPRPALCKQNTFSPCSMQNLISCQASSPNVILHFTKTDETYRNFYFSLPWENVCCWEVNVLHQVPSTKIFTNKNCHHEVRGTSSDLNSPVLSDDFLLLLTHILGCQEQGVSQSEHSRKYCNKY